jgi:LysR family cyn operon transcriptional activator
MKASPATITAARRQSNAFIVHLFMQIRYQSRMNLRHLRAFAAIVDAGGFARAAQRLHLSQPALSRQIHALEAALGVPLFDRVGRRSQLTAQGEDLLRRSRRLLAEADSLGERARSLKSGESGILRFGATPQVIENLLAKFLVRYRRRHPGVEVHLVEDGGARLHERLERGEVHLAIAPAGGRRVERRLLFPMHVVAAMPPGHSLSGRRAVEIGELRDEPLLLLRREFGSREWFDLACQAAHLRPRVMLESAAPHTLVALAATGYGIAILPSNAELPQRLVRAVPVLHRGVAIGRWSEIVWHPERFLPPYAERFVAELVAECRRGYPGRDLVRRAPPVPRP